MRAVEQDEELKRFYRRKLVQKGMGKARIAVARLGFGYGSCSGIRLIVQSSAEADGRGRRGKPMRGCLDYNMVLRRSDPLLEVNEWQRRLTTPAGSYCVRR